MDIRPSLKKEREILRVQSNSHYNIRKVQFIKTALKNYIN